MRLFHPAVREWFEGAFTAPTPAQSKGWAAIARGESTLLLAPTGSGKTLAAFLWCLDRLMFGPEPTPRERCRVLYVSPLKALAVDVERNLRAPIAGISNTAARRGDAFRIPGVLVRTGDTPSNERARFQRDPADIVITTPESLYLMLTSNAREALRSVETVIVDEIHALVPTKRGAHLALSIERLEALAGRKLQRIGLSATQRPLDEVARFLGGVEPRPTTLTPVSASAGVGGGGLSPTSRRIRRSGGQSPTPVAESANPVAEFATGGGDVRYRPVTIADAGHRKALRLRIEVPVEDMARLGQPIDLPSGPAGQGLTRPSIWSAIHPRLLELVQAHRSTLIFVNSRRTAERLAAALNELAGEPLVRAHHGSLAREQRNEVEDALKAGRLRGLVATSSLELGIDMGALDLVVQIEAPPSVASGLQRIGRASHHVGAVSDGIIFPKYRGDLVACAAAARAMHEGHVEATRYPRNPLDVLAQQIVSAVAMDTWKVDDLFDLVRRAAPYAELDRNVFEGVLDMLAGRYPSDAFAELRPRITWDRVRQTLTAREGAKRVAIANGGTIPDRGLYGVFLTGAPAGSARVGELDEEMVFESRVGETFLLGASTWRIEDITHDKVYVSPAPGEPGKMPFWKGEAPGRPLEFGRAIGALIRSLRSQPAPAAIERLVRDHDLDQQAAANLLQYLADQQAAIGHVPDDRTIVIERCRDELGDWRVCLLSPLGGKVLAPWAMAILAKIREETGIEAETLWTDDGLVVRFPETDDPPDPALLIPDPEELERLLLRQIGSTSLFAARFREAAARALLLPRRRIGGRMPLWQQRKRAADLLAVAAQFGSFPMLLEAYRECIRDLFDLPALAATLRDIQQRTIRVVTVDSTQPSPFAASLLFGYVANYMYEGDAPLAERRAQALSIDHAQLRALLGDAELREVLDRDAIDEVERELQQLDPARRFRSADGLHDMLLRLGDLSADEIAARASRDIADAAIGALVSARRAVRVPIAGEPRYIAVEDVSRYRDAVGVPLPQGLPDSLLNSVPDPVGDLVMRYARTHGPFTAEEVAARFGLARPPIDAALRRAVAAGRLYEGDFRPGGLHREWCEPGVLAQIRRRSLAKIRRDVEPVEPPVLARLLAAWQGVTRPRRGLDALLDVVESLQGAPIPASILERDVLPARIDGYEPSQLDTLLAAGEVVWVGVEPLGERDGRVALYLTDHLPRLWRGRDESGLGEREARILAHLTTQGASFFGPLHESAGGGYPRDTVDALWTLVWRGLITNDSMQALRAFIAGDGAGRERRTRPPAGMAGRPFRSRRQVPPTAEGRWSLIATRLGSISGTEWSAGQAQQLLTRYGIVTRGVMTAENVPGGFSSVYDVLRTMEERGRIRRGFFVTDVGAAQFALPPALDLLRSLRQMPDEPEVLMLAASDPANPYGTILRWPGDSSSTDRVAPDGVPSDATSMGRRAPAAAGVSSAKARSEGRSRKRDADEASPGRRTPTRSAGARVVLVDGRASAWISRGGRQILTWLPDAEPDRSRTGRAIAERLALIAQEGEGREGGLLVAEVDGIPAADHPIAPFLIEAGFVRTAMGYQVPRSRAAAAGARAPAVNA
ncbi:MAG TPA: DEAD/DEAH box helicase [Vicinamibacterales bacterium]